VSESVVEVGHREDSHAVIVPGPFAGCQMIGTRRRVRWGPMTAERAERAVRALQLSDILDATFGAPFRRRSRGRRGTLSAWLPSVATLRTTIQVNCIWVRLPRGDVRQRAG